ncbi:hypothetical protein M1N79_03430 [Dehalococcoidia bacterium]|nr:hypothetical protein [Dehalococcoidia bacterium]
MRQAVEGAGKSKVTLVAKVDQGAIPALDQVANANDVNTAQLMSQFLSDIGDAVEFLNNAQSGSFATVGEWFARLIAQRCRGATPEALRAVGHIWDRAAELKTREGGGEG